MLIKNKIGLYLKSKTNVFVVGVLVGAIIISAVDSYKDVNVSVEETQNKSVIDNKDVPKEFKDKISKALRVRFASGKVYSYELTLNNLTNSVISVNEKGEMFVQTPTVLDSEKEKTDSQDLFYISDAYFDVDGNYYKANNTIGKDDKIQTEWIKYNSDIKDIIENKKVAYTRDLLSNSTNIEHIGKTDITPELTGVDLYRLDATSNVFYDVFASELVQTYESLLAEAKFDKDKEFSDYTENVLSDIKMMSIFSDGYVEVGLKNNNLYYLGFVSGGGGNKVIAQMLFTDQLQGDNIMPNIKDFITLYEDAKEAYYMAKKEHQDTSHNIEGIDELN